MGGDRYLADRVRGGRRPGRRRLRRQPGAPRRQRHRVHLVRIRPKREMAGAAQRDRAGRDASGGPSGFRHIRWDRPAQFSPWRRRLAWKQSRRMCAMPARSNAPSRHSARGSNGGLIVTASGLAIVHRELIVTLAARHKLPAVYYYRFFVTDGGLVSYGPIRTTSTGARPATSTASSKAKNQPIFRCRLRRSTSWSSTSRPPRRSASKFRRRYSPAPTR